ncbi:MAG: hypothetical protein N4A45_10795 [Flavobacteriales bacterium]|jgi:hypothetical protein|nr:hypothetical protein [Flavobacteriales bacterium]
MKRFFYFSKAYFFLAIASIFSLLSCSEIFEGDLSDDHFKLIAPSQNLVTSENTVNFAWDELEEASSYHLRLVSPNFNQTKKLVYDTNLVGSSFTVSLLPGEYQWRIYAQNELTKTDAITGIIRIDSTIDLRAITPILLSPSKDTYTKLNSIDFSWEALYNASAYYFSIKQENGSTQNYDSLLQTSLVIDTLPEGAYSWSLKAFNANSETFSIEPTRNLWVDRTVPTTPSNMIPLDTTINVLNIGGDSLLNLSWDGEIATSSQAPIRDYLTFSQNSSFSGSQTITIDINEANDRNYQFKIPQAGTYYWKVQSEDRAGNKSVESGSHKAHIQFQ